MKQRLKDLIFKILSVKILIILPLATLLLIFTEKLTGALWVAVVGLVIGGHEASKYIKSRKGQ